MNTPIGKSNELPDHFETGSNSKALIEYENYDDYLCVFTADPSAIALEAAEDHSAIDGRSGVLLGVYGAYGLGGALPSQPTRAHGFCATSADPCVRG
jgi:hypothetical protein